MKIKYMSMKLKFHRHEIPIAPASVCGAMLLHAIEILPERLYPYYLLAKLYAEPDFYRPDKLQAAAYAVLTKEPKVESRAIMEMREEIKKILEKK